MEQVGGEKAQTTTMLAYQSIELLLKYVYVYMLHLPLVVSCLYKEGVLNVVVNNQRYAT